MVICLFKSLQFASHPTQFVYIKTRVHSLSNSNVMTILLKSSVHLIVGLSKLSLSTLGLCSKMFFVYLLFKCPCPTSLNLCYSLYMFLTSVLLHLRRVLCNFLADVVVRVNITAPYASTSRTRFASRFFFSC